jgi:hypothetical protein
MIGTKLGMCLRDLPYIIPTKLYFIWPCSFSGEIFLILTNQKQVLPMSRRSSTNLPFFLADQTSNMVDMGNTCFWLVKIRKISPLKLQGQMKYNLVGIMYGRSRKQIPNVKYFFSSNLIRLTRVLTLKQNKKNWFDFLWQN